MNQRECSSNSMDTIAEWMKERHSYRHLLPSKREQFGTQKSEKSSLQQLWNMINWLLGRGVIPPSDKIDAGQFLHYFYEKVTGVQSSPMPSFEQSSADASINYFQTVSLDKIVAAVKALLDKSCTLDSLSTVQLKAVVDVISPYLPELFNRSPSFGMSQTPSE